MVAVRLSIDASAMFLSAEVSKGLQKYVASEIRRLGFGSQKASLIAKAPKSQ